MKEKTFLNSETKTNIALNLIKILSKESKRELNKVIKNIAQSVIINPNTV